MSGGLPIASGHDHIKVLEEQFGWAHVRTNGSHAILTKPGEKLLVTVPCHGKDPLKRGTLGAVLRAAGIPPDEYSAAFAGGKKKSGSRRAAPSADSDDDEPSS